MLDALWSNFNDPMLLLSFVVIWFPDLFNRINNEILKVEISDDNFFAGLANNISGVKHCSNKTQGGGYNILIKELGT